MVALDAASPAVRGHRVDNTAQAEWPLEEGISVTEISRRSIAKGAAWAAPAVAVGTVAPAFASSPEQVGHFECPSDPGRIADVVSAISSVVVSDDGLSTSRAVLDFTVTNIVPKPVYNAAGTKLRDTTGLYLLPGCGKTRCDPDLPGGFQLPTGYDAVSYAADGKQYKGRVVSATPAGCSPSLNGLFEGRWTVLTGVPYTATPCLATADKRITQISVPMSLMYLDGLGIVKTAAGGSCCIYLNALFGTDDCTLPFTATNTWFTLGAPAPSPFPLPRITSATPNYAKPGTAVTVKGTNFTGATAVTYNGVAVSYQVKDDGTLTFNMPNTGAAAIYYDLVVYRGKVASNHFSLARG